MIARASPAADFEGLLILQATVDELDEVYTLVEHLTDATRSRRRIELSQRSHVIENPERATMGSHDDVVVMDDKVSNRRRRHIQAEALPMVAIVDGEIDSPFGPGEQKSAP